jgi:hypothetical protein
MRITLPRMCRRLGGRVVPASTCTVSPVSCFRETDVSVQVEDSKHAKLHRLVDACFETFPPPADECRLRFNIGLDSLAARSMMLVGNPWLHINRDCFRWTGILPPRRPRGCRKPFASRWLVPPAEHGRWAHPLLASIYHTRLLAIHPDAPDGEPARYHRPNAGRSCVHPGRDHANESDTAPTKCASRHCFALVPSRGVSSSPSVRLPELHQLLLKTPRY